MDAYDLSDMIKRMWMDHADKNSGQLDKSGNKINVIVNTEEGYRRVVGLHWNREIKSIELVLDDE